MFATQRQERILDQVRLTGGVRVADLVEELGVSDMTIRRDIAALAAQGRVDRVHGGATAAASRDLTPSPFDPSTVQRRTRETAIAGAAASLVAPGSSVALSGGTTTYEVALALRSISDLTVFTNSLPIADVLHDPHREDLTVVLTGGVRTASGSLIGPVTTAALRDLHVDWAFLGAHGLDEQAGVTVHSLVEAETSRALMAVGRRVAFVIDSEKWQTVGLATVAHLDLIDVLVSDSGLSRRAHKVLRSLVKKLVVVEA